MQYEYLSLLRKDELRTIRKSKREFKKELALLKENLDFFLKSFEVLSKEKVQDFSFSQDASYRISYKIFRLMRCAFNSSLEGYYDVAMALLRIAYENHLLMNYLSKNEREAKLWFEGKIYKPTFLRKNVSYSSDSLYRDMCEFIHSSFKSTFAFTETENGKAKATLGEYNKTHFMNVFMLMQMTLISTMIWLSLTFAQELMINEKWHSVFKKTVPKIWKSIKTGTSK